MHLLVQRLAELSEFCVVGQSRIHLLSGIRHLW